MQKPILSLLLSLITIQLTAQRGFESKVESFIQPLLNDYRLIKTDAKTNPFATTNSSWHKRVEVKSKTLFRNKYNQKDYQEYTFTFIYFESTDACKIARQTYIDHFSPDGRLTHDAKGGIKRAPSFNLINDHAIIIFEVSCEGHKMDDTWSWQYIKEALSSSFGSDQSEIIENGCGGPIIWKNDRSKS